MSILLSFYRLYASLLVGVAVYPISGRSIKICVFSAIAFRLLWFAAERTALIISINLNFKRHIYKFKQQLGPYGIRLANKAENDWTVKKSLAEVFTSSLKKLEKNVEHLKLMDTLFSAGMRPDDETFQINDCKLKYGLYRLNMHTQKKQYKPDS
jgi:hypothetical protein